MCRDHRNDDQNFGRVRILTACMLQVSLFDARPVQSPEIFEDYLKRVPKDRLAKILRYQARLDRAMSLGASLLLQAGYAYFGLDYTPPTQDSHGKPCDPESRIYFNLSHSGGLVLGVFSDVAPVGADIELIRPLAHDLARRFFLHEEQVYLYTITDPDQRRDAFFRLWTLKESYAKATGLGLAKIIKSQIILPCTKKIVDSGGVWFLQEYSLSNWRAAVCSREVLPPKREFSFSF